MNHANNDFAIYTALHGILWKSNSLDLGTFEMRSTIHTLTHRVRALRHTYNNIVKHRNRNSMYVTIATMGLTMHNRNIGERGY